MPQAQTKRPDLSSQKARTGQPTRDRTSRQQLLFCSQIAQRKPVAHPNPQPQILSMEARFYPWFAVMSHPTSPLGWCQRRPGLSFPPGGIKAPPHSASGDHMGFHFHRNLDFYPSMAVISHHSLPLVEHGQK